MNVNLLVLGAALAVAAALVHPRVARARLWRAALTPLASIIGSGFLVLGPVLDASYGVAAPLVMAGLCALAWAFGAAIRLNIAAIEAAGAQGGPPDARRLETLASWALAFAYVVSVAYYLNLFGAFAVRLTEVDDRHHARLVASAAFAVILAVGWLRGFGALERMEQIAVGLKLAVIAALLAGLCAWLWRQAEAGALSADPPRIDPLHGAAVALGLIVTVQGFETSRYLGHAYDARTRIRSMRLAQGLATAIYVAYAALYALGFAPPEGPLRETAVIDAVRAAAPILPALLVAAALSAQFSAAIADAAGSGGLMHELTRGRIAPRHGYALLTAIGLALTWRANVFEIIAYASRAFALYYAIQALIAAEHARAAGVGRARIAGLWALAAIGAAAALFGAPVEGG